MVLLDRMLGAMRSGSNSSRRMLGVLNLNQRNVDPHANNTDTIKMPLSIGRTAEIVVNTSLNLNPNAPNSRMGTIAATGMGTGMGMGIIIRRIRKLIIIISTRHDTKLRSRRVICGELDLPRCLRSIPRGGGGVTRGMGIRQRAKR